MNMIMRIGVMGIVAASPLYGLAQAQENYYSRDKYEAVTDRQQPEFDPELVRLGTFVVNANTEAGITSTSNVFAASANEQSDTIIRVGAQANARTNWNVHEIGLQVSAFRDNYLDASDESNNDFRVRARGRLDVTRAFSVGANAFAEDRAESRTEFANAIGLDRPIQFQRTGGGLSTNYNVDRVRWNASVDVSDYDFEDGQVAGGTNTFDQDFRDRTVVNARSRLTYALSPDLAVFGQASVNSAEYDNLQFTGLTPRSRDSEGYTIEAGVNFELKALVRGDIAVGYFSEDKADNTFADVTGLSLDGRMQWFPSRLTTVTFDAGRRVVDLGLIEAPTATQTQLGVRVDHELRRNIILSLSGRRSDNSYDDIDRNEDVIQLGMQGVYKINKRVHIEAFARYLNRDVSGAQVTGNPTFSVNLIGIGFKLFP